MYFDTVAAALAMDGHGIYVWPVYMLAIMALSVLILLPGARARKTLRQLAGEIKRMEPRQDTVTRRE